VNDDAGDEVEGASGGRPRERRHRAREAALQMLYQWEVGREPIDQVIESYWDIDRPGERPLSSSLRAFATSLAQGTAGHLDDIDPLIGENAEHWRPSRMAIVDRLILRLAVHEFLHGRDIPKKVVINEALELARTFSTDESVGFVNGILDAIMRQLETAPGLKTGGPTEAGPTRTNQ
jgi:N utilization substance protein B